MQSGDPWSLPLSLQLQQMLAHAVIDSMVQQCEDKTTVYIVSPDAFIADRV